MALQPGQRLAHYEIREKIGAGGMGEVWRATDTRLSRDVALKALPDDVARDPERLARFRREAQLLAALNHPNIAAIHGLEEVDGQVYLALELVAGEDLAARLKRGPLPADEAIDLALQIAAALEGAHEQGIIHRDLKPANVKVTPEGKVKILDFGLAKALEPATDGNASASLSPTMTAAATRAGIILGTAAYMSPEQARGALVDKRSDIWAFGCVLLEMLSGRNVFSEPTVSDTLASVLKSEPDWKALPAGTSPAMRRLLERCLRKDHKNRLRDIGEARIALEEIRAGAPETTARTEIAPAAAGGWRWPAIALTGAILAAALSWWAAIATRPSAPVEGVRRFEIAHEGLQVDMLLSPAISPDGRKVVYVNDDRLWIREIDRVEPHPLAGTEWAQAPFWSPDSSTVGFVRGNDLWKVSPGARPVTIATALGTFGTASGFAWLPDDRIVYARGDTGLLEISSMGGEPRPLLSPGENEADFHRPSALPGGRGVLFIAHRTEAPDTISVLTEGERKNVLTIASEELFNPVWSPTGHILYRRGGQRAGLWAVPFSLDRMETTAEPFLVSQDADHPSFASDGTLLYVRGATQVREQLAWVNRDGGVEAMLSQPQMRQAAPALSPDGSRVVVMGQENETWDIWVHDVARSTKTRLTFTSVMDWDPVWTPDGSRIVYWSGSTRAISWIPADGAGSTERLVSENLPDSGVPSIASDGSTMVFWARPAGEVDDIWVMSLAGERTTRPLLASPAREDHPRLSPKMRHLLYVSDASGRNEVYLTKFPTGEGKWQVSTNGGTMPRWSPGGDRIFYVQVEEQDRYMMEVPVVLEPVVSLDAPRRLFGAKTAGLNIGDMTRYDVSADGQRFLMVKPLRPEGERPRLVLVDNWTREFEKTQ